MHTDSWLIDISMDTPLRLNVAAEVAFPDGSMTGAGLFNEHRQGRLEIERIDRKLYTTLADIGKMRSLCRAVVSGQRRQARGAKTPANDNRRLVASANTRS